VSTRPTISPETTSLSGIGGCFTLEEFEDFHQRNWLHGFGDRELNVEPGGRGMGYIGEGKYACGGL